MSLGIKMSWGAYEKHKFLVFLPNQRNQNFQRKWVFNKRFEWALFHSMLRHSKVSKCSLFTPASEVCACMCVCVCVWLSKQSLGPHSRPNVSRVSESMAQESVFLAISPDDSYAR